jgi:hypothetical protein
LLRGECPRFGQERAWNNSTATSAFESIDDIGQQPMVQWRKQISPYQGEDLNR